jgi:hypothetical protein
MKGSFMLNEEMRSYIANLPVGTYRPALLQEEENVVAADINNLPNGIVTGSNLIQFSKEVSSEIKSSVALSLLAAQQVAKNDTVIVSPQQWIERHNTVLTNLNWHIQDGGVVNTEFKDIDMAVHQAIIPFLTAIFGGALTAGALIITALTQLKEMDKNSPWITLFDRESRRFDVSEYQFSVVQVAGDDVTLKLAAARFNASFGKTQVLFFKLNKQTAKFDAATQNLSANSGLLIDMNKELRSKLARFTKTYIQSLPF